MRVKTLFISAVALIAALTSIGTHAKTESDEISMAYEQAEAVATSDPSKSVEIIKSIESKILDMSDESKVEYFAKISGYYLFLDDIKSMSKSVDSGLSFASKDSISSFVVDLYNYKGYVFTYTKKENPEPYFKSALSISKRTNYEMGILDSYLNLTAHHISESQYVLAHDYSEKAFALAKSTNNTEYMAHASGLIGNIYAHMDRHEDAIKYRTSSTNAYKELDNHVSVNISNMAIAHSMIALKRYHLAESMLIEILGSAYTIKADRFSVYQLLADIYTSQDRYAEANYYINESKKYIDLINSQPTLGRWYVSRINILVGLNKLDEAKELIDVLENGDLFKDNKVTRTVKIQYILAKSNYFEQKGDYKKSLNYYKEYNDQWTELKNSNSSNLISELRIKFETDKIEQENSELIHKNELSTVKLAESEKYKKNQLLIIVISIGILIALIPMLLHQISLRKKLSEMVNIDSMTKVYNRHYLMNKGHYLYEQSRRRTVNSIILLDIDNFKSINDQYGHSMGDQVLKKVASLCSTAVRNTDRFGRMGGEEFVAILPNTTIDEAMDVSERIRKAIEQCAWDEFGISHNITVSVGVSMLSNQDEGGFQKVLNLADKAMYKAKTTGKNKVVSL